jgi:hypothetical protein
MRSSYLHATYAEKVAIPQVKRETSILPEPLYTSLGIDVGATSVEQRLIRAKVLVDERTAEIEFDRKVRLSNIIFGSLPKNYIDQINALHTKTVSEKFGNALQANSAFMNLINRTAVPDDMDELMMNGFKVITSGERSFQKIHSEWIANGCRGTVYNLADIGRSSNMYLRSDVSCEENLKVGGISLIFTEGALKVKQTVTKVGLYNISSSQREWAEKLGSDLSNFQKAFPEGIPKEIVLDLYYENREWVADDTMIVSHAMKAAFDGKFVRLSAIAIITTDEKLCRRVATSTDCTVLLYHPVKFIQLCKKKGHDWETPIKNPETFFPAWTSGPVKMKQIRHYEIDTGSMLAHLSKRKEMKGSMFKRTTREVGRRNGMRYERFTLHKDSNQGLNTYKVFIPGENQKPARSYAGSDVERKALSEDSVYPPSQSDISSKYSY